MNYKQVIGIRIQQHTGLNGTRVVRIPTQVTPWIKVFDRRIDLCINGDITTILLKRF